MIDLHLPFDGHRRRVRVFVPAGADPAPPLLVMFDGQNVFGDEGSFAGGWHAHEAVTKLPGTVRRPIVVGVDHGAHKRAAELTHGLADVLAFVQEEVVPHTRARVPCEAGPVSIGGSSLGGLAALLALVRHPAAFRSALVMSPSLWVGRGAAIREALEADLPTWSMVYLDVGLKERGAMATLATRLARGLTQRLAPDQLMWRPDRQGTHRERHWRRRLPKALRFLFHRTKRPR